MSPDEETPAMAADREQVIEQLLERYAGVPGGLLPLLHAVQEALGCIPPETVPRLARGMGLSRAEVHGVITFYHDFRLEPPGEHVIHLCRAEACQAMGARALEAHAKARLGIGFGQTTADGRYTLEPVYCLGNCACSPSLRIGDEVHARVTPEKFDQLVGGD
jgi:formate dehydrogenase subunit gamma